MSDAMTLTRRRFLQTCAATGTAAMAVPWLSGQAPAAPRNRPPNIMLISTDQWHAEAFGHLGSPWLKTPHSDRIAQRGVPTPPTPSAPRPGRPG